VAETLWRRCGGNPLLLVDAAAGWGQPVGQEAGEPTVRLSDQTVRSLLAGLEPDAVRCAQATTVFGGPFSPEMAAEVAQLGGRGGDRALDALCQAGVLRELPDLSLDFAQPLLREALYPGISLPMRRRYHARAFTALARRGHAAGAADHAPLADLSEIGDAVAVVSRAATRALEGGSSADAARHFRAAVELAGEAASFDLRVSLAQALLLSGRPVAAGSVLERLHRHGEIPDQPAARAQVLVDLADACSAAGRRTSASRHYLEAGEAAGVAAPDLAARALLSHALVGWQLEGLPTAVTAIQRARPLCRPDDPRLAAVDAYIATLAGSPPASLDQDDPAWRGLEDPRRRPDALATPLGSAELFGEVAICVGRAVDAERFLKVMVTIARHEGSLLTAARLATTRADALLRQGLLEEAETQAAAAERASEGAPGVQALAAAVRAEILFQRGARAASEDACAQALSATRGGEEPLAALWVMDVRGQHQLQDAEPARASALYGELEKSAERLGLAEPCVLPWAAHAITAHVASGDIAHATCLTRWLEDVSARLPCTWPRVATAQGRAMLAEQAGDLPAAEAELRAGIELALLAGLELDRVALLLALGRLLRRARRPCEARGPLAHGLDAAEQAGAGLLVADFRDELRAAGGRRVRRFTAGAELTAQERRVADLAACGRTNRQIAASLSVTVNTVETHLQRAYEKLGVRSRTQLAAIARAHQDAGDQGNP
jgi:DNA-binding NarL/FixJ family response regulator